MEVLELASKVDAPFLVIEPDSNRYRSLLKNERLAARLRVYTAGNSLVAPLPINPLEIIPGVNIWTHIGRVVEIFRHCYELSAPVEHALELCVVQAYVDLGWSPITNSNWRLSLDAATEQYVPELQPTLKDVLRVVDPIVDGCDFAPYVSTDIKTILKSIFRSLLSGQAKQMFTQRSRKSMEELFLQPTVVELTTLGNEPTKSFVVQVLLLFLEEYSAQHRPESPDGFTLVIEGAHSLHGLRIAGESIEQEPTMQLDKILQSLQRFGVSTIVVADPPSETRLTAIHRNCVETATKAKGRRKTDPSEPAARKLDNRSGSPSSTGSVALCADSMIRDAMARTVDEHAPIDCIGCGRWPGGCGAETHFLADQLISDYGFRTSFYVYILSATRNIAELVHSRKRIVKEAERVMGGRFSQQVFWCALAHTFEQYFAGKAREHFWSLELEQGLKLRFLDFMAMAFIEAERPKTRLDAAPILQWRDDFVAAQTRSAGPLPTCSDCKMKCLYRLEVSELTNQSVQFDFNSSINRRDQPASESAAWFTRLLSERLVGAFDPGIAFCAAVHLIRVQALSDDAQRTLLEKVQARLNEFESGDAESGQEAKQG